MRDLNDDPYIPRETTASDDKFVTKSNLLKKKHQHPFGGTSGCIA